VSHDHAHGDQAALPSARRRLTIVLVIAAVLAVAELAGGLATGSLTLLADAGHMMSDVGGLGMALFAAWVAERPASPRRTFGSQRAEILAAMANAVLLALVMVSVVRGAVLRFEHPAPPDVGPMFVLGTLGLLANIGGILLLRPHAHTSLNLRGAYLEVGADLLASLGVLAAASLTYFMGWKHADPVLSLALAAFIAPRIAHLLRDATDVLMETAPRGLDVDAVRDAIGAVSGVVAVHDLHVWAITPRRVCLSAHLVGRTNADRDGLVAMVNGVLHERFGIGHTTLQVEGPGADATARPGGCDPCDAVPASAGGVTPPRATDRTGTGV
jgi:cobalt-zinc-cadmium efflux system protein